MDRHAVSVPTCKLCIGEISRKVMLGMENTIVAKEIRELKFFDTLHFFLETGLRLLL